MKGENMKLDELKRAQRSDSWVKSILHYLEHGLLLQDTVKAKKVTAKSHKYILDNSILSHVQNHGLPKTRGRRAVVYSKVYEMSHFGSFP